MPKSLHGGSGNRALWGLFFKIWIPFIGLWFHNQSTPKGPSTRLPTGPSDESSTLPDLLWFHTDSLISQNTPMASHTQRTFYLRGLLHQQEPQHGLQPGGRGEHPFVGLRTLSAEVEDAVPQRVFSVGVALTDFIKRQVMIWLYT